MGMDTYITGRQAPNATFNKMLAVYEACAAAKIDTPKEVLEFFNYETPNKNGATVSLPKGVVVKEPAECKDVWVVDLSKVPSGVTHLVFTNSY